MATPEDIALRRFTAARDLIPPSVWNSGFKLPENMETLGHFRYLLIELKEGRPLWAYTAISLEEAADLIESTWGLDADTDDVTSTEVHDLDTGATYAPEITVVAFIRRDNQERIAIAPPADRKLE